MKKLYGFIILLGLVLLLAACGSDQASKKEQSNGDTESSSTSQLTTEQKMEKYEYTSEEFGDYFLLGIYTNKAEGLSYEPISVTFDNFTLEGGLSLVEIDLNEEAKKLEQFSGKDTVRAVMLEMETDNENDYEFTYHGRATAKTETGDELTGFISPDSELVKDYTTDDYIEHGIMYFLLDDLNSEPKQLEITFEPPERDGKPVGDAQTVKSGDLVPESDLDK
ncbi:hypothetical protein SFC66_06475 [Terribacillus saccharophilus]|uniref:hypothetical protein n=1 Tax=Terribacillus saccharophilus TaxID=361277 RepID=UPI003981B6D6